MLQKILNDDVPIFLIELSLLEGKAALVSGIDKLVGSQITLKLIQSVHE